MPQPALTLTEQQQQARAAFRVRPRRTVVMDAGAGAAKTTTLRFLAEDAKEEDRLGVFLSFNASVAKEAGRKFPRNVGCFTGHGYATYASNGYWQERIPKPGQRRSQPGKEVARLFGVPDRRWDVAAGIDPVSQAYLGKLIVQTVDAFCRTADQELAAHHVPVPPRWQHEDDVDALHARLARLVLPYAHEAWTDLRGRTGKLIYKHSYYLKRLQLAHRPIQYKGRRADFVLIDECQDLDPVLAAIVKDQLQFGIQVVIVGDRFQAINDWNGATNIMGDFPDALHVQLSKSFRFGPVIAAEANRWLQLYGADLRIEGCAAHESSIGPIENPDAILCRTNAGAMEAVMNAQARDQKVHLVKGGGGMKSLAEAAIELRDKGWTPHPELARFGSWGEVQDFIDEGDLGSEDLRIACQLIDRHTPEKIIDAIGKLVDDPHRAHVTVSTAHRAKGLEWDTVQVHDDFRVPDEDKDPSEEEIMLNYVTITRAKRRVAPGPLAYIDRYVPAQPEHPHLAVVR